jgi:hypothetical protein
MKAWDYEGVHVFAEDGSGHMGTYCNYCFVKACPGMDIEADNIAPIFATDESDYYPECEMCGGVFEYINLTEEGKAEVEDREFWNIVDANYTNRGGA